MRKGEQTARNKRNCRHSLEIIGEILLRSFFVSVTSVTKCAKA